MIKTSFPIFLASKSPRRKKLLEQIGLTFSVLTQDIDESIKENEPPIGLVQRLSKEKAEAVAHLEKGIFISADTIVVIDNKILNKPADEQEAFTMLKKLSGITHTVYTGFTVYNNINEKEITTYEATEVTFRILDDEEVWDYIKTGSPLDKAGAYGIQDDFGAVFISKINGDYYNVVGLPLHKVYLAINEVL